MTGSGLFGPSPFPKKKKLLIKRFIALLSVHMFKRKISIYSVCLCQICTVAMGNLILKISPVFFIFFRYVPASVCVIFCQFCETLGAAKRTSPRIRSPRRHACAARYESFQTGEGFTDGAVLPAYISV